MMAESLVRDDLRVEWREIASLIPDPRNARSHSEAQVAALAGSLREFGWMVPIVVQSDGSIIAGHGRILAAQKLGETKAPCISADHLTPAQRRAYVLADNRLAELATWDDELLKVELGELRDTGFDLELVGFDSAALTELGLDIEPIDLPELPSGERSDLRQMTFTLHETQAEQIDRAIAAAKTMGPFGDTGNENGNGNALARICETFLTYRGA